MFSYLSQENDKKRGTVGTRYKKHASRAMKCDLDRGGVTFFGCGS